MTKRLLICAQAVDSGDTAVGFFVLWVSELAKRFESVTVLCLREGAYALPDNVRVVHLGSSRLGRAYRTLRYIVGLRREYDAVFVHQGQEFVLVGGWLWGLLGKPVYLWRNHYAGSLFTDIAAAFCTKIFCTSKHSYTAKFKKTTLMPVGVDTGVFSPVQGIVRAPRSVLSLGRIAPSKRLEVLIEALGLLARKGVDFSATIVGTPLPKDQEYCESLKKSAQELGSRIAFVPGVPSAQTPRLFSAHQAFVNCSRSGMYDKTIFEAAACGCGVLASSDDWRALAGDQYYFKDAAELAGKLEGLLAAYADLRPLAQAHSLEALMGRLREEIS